MYTTMVLWLVIEATVFNPFFSSSFLIPVLKGVDVISVSVLHEAN